MWYRWTFQGEKKAVCCRQLTLIFTRVLIKDIQHFALKIVSKLWSQDYYSLLSELRLVTLSHRRKKNIYTIFKLKNNLSHVITSPLTPLPHHIQFSRHYILPIISPQSSSIILSLIFPSAISLWNSLPDQIKSSTTLSFINQNCSISLNIH